MCFPKTWLSEFLVFLVGKFAGFKMHKNLTQIYRVQSCIIWIHLNFSQFVCCTNSKELVFMNVKLCIISVITFIYSDAKIIVRQTLCNISLSIPTTQHGSTPPQVPTIPLPSLAGTPRGIRGPRGSSPFTLFLSHSILSKDITQYRER